MRDQSPNESNALEYFTNREDILKVFDQMLSEEALKKRILAIYGVGGVGKSSLVRVFRLKCRRTTIPVGLASGDEAKSAIDVLSHWTTDLAQGGANLRRFRRSLHEYRSILAQVTQEAGKHDKAGTDLLGKVTARTAKATVSGLATVALGSVVPGVGAAAGAILGEVGGSGVEMLTGWLRRFLSKSEIDLILEPSRQLTHDFSRDIERIASRERIVLILDTFEQIATLSDWLCHLTRSAHQNALFVIAGRSLPNWDRVWPGWLGQTDLRELEPMPPDVIRELVGRYYSYVAQRGTKPDPKQVASIALFARGLPIAVTSAVRLWVKYGVEDFRTVRPEVIADLADCLIEGVPRSLRPALEAAATLRWFNRDLLETLLAQQDIGDAYEELRRFPFVTSKAEGLKFHDVVREVIDEKLRLHSPDYHRLLHQRAASYFKSESARIARRDPEKASMEWLYHLMKADEDTGIQAFQELAEELARYYLVDRLSSLMGDVNTYQLECPNSRLWRDYYSARLLEIRVHFSEAAQIYKRISDSKLAEPRLQAYALCDLGHIWRRNYYLTQPGGVERALSVVKRSQEIAPGLDSKLVMNFSHLRSIHVFTGELDKAVEAQRQQLEFCQEYGDRGGVVYSLDKLKDLYGLLGDWGMAFDAERKGLDVLDSTFPNRFLRARLLGTNARHKYWSGQYSEAESDIKQALTLAEEERQTDSLPSLYKSLGLVMGLQKCWDESSHYFTQALNRYKERSYLSIGFGSTLGFRGLILSRRGKFSKAEQNLTRGLSLKKELEDNNGIPEILVWLGQLYEMQARIAENEQRADHLAQAMAYYNQTLEYHWTSRRYHECTAFAGLMRLEYSVGNYGRAVDLFIRAKNLAEEYRYQDLLASLHLHKGHVQWSGFTDDWPRGFDAAAASYKQALLHALAYNRFLLDEILWGGEVSTPLVTIVSRCYSNELEGHSMANVLSNWWRTDSYKQDCDFYGAHSLANRHTISLTQAEALARRCEPGDRTPQRTVLKILEFT